MHEYSLQLFGIHIILSAGFISCWYVLRQIQHAVEKMADAHKAQ